MVPRGGIELPAPRFSVYHSEILRGSLEGAELRLVSLVWVHRDSALRARQRRRRRGAPVALSLRGTFTIAFDGYRISYHQGPTID
jgi:hypothetical protein